MRDAFSKRLFPPRQVAGVFFSTALVLVSSVIAIRYSFSQAVAPVQPKLVLFLSIDQMRFDYLTRFEPLYKGGLKTLLDRGAVFTDANYRHSSTETGPGHSVILSGRHPSHSGIVANAWYDSYLHKLINVIEDPVQSPVGGDRKSTRLNSSHGYTS